MEFNEIFWEMWYDYSVLAIRVNVKMVSTRFDTSHAKVLQHYDCIEAAIPHLRGAVSAVF